MSDHDDSIRTLFKGGGVLLVGLVFQLAISFLAQLVIARELTLSEFGGVSLGTTVASVVATVCLLGMQEGIGRFLPRFETAEERRGVLVSAFQLVVPLGLLAGAILLLAAPSLATTVFDSPEITPVLRVFALVVPLIVVHRLVMSTIQGNQQSIPKVLVENLLRPSSRFLAIGVVIVVGISSTRVAWAYFVGWAIPVLVGIVYLARYTSLFRVSTAAQTKRREMLHFSIPLLFSAALSLVFNDLDTLLLGYFSDSPAPVGVYNVVYPLANLLTTATMAFGFLFMPIISQLHADGELDRVRRTYMVVTKWVFMGTLPVFLVTVLFPVRLISLTFGAKYASGGAALSVLAAGFFFHSIMGLNRETVVSIGATRVKMGVDVGAAALNLTLNLLLIPSYGPLGAAVATTVTFLCLNVLLSGYLYRSVGIVPFSPALLRPAAVGIASFLCVYAVIRSSLSPTPTVLVVGFTIFVLAYGIAVLRFGGIEEEEVVIVHSVEERFGVDLEPVKRIARQFM